MKLGCDECGSEEEYLYMRRKISGHDWVCFGCMVKEHTKQYRQLKLEDMYGCPSCGETLNEAWGVCPTCGWKPGYAPVTELKEIMDKMEEKSDSVDECVAAVRGVVEAYGE